MSPLGGLLLHLLSGTRCNTAELGVLGQVCFHESQPYIPLAQTSC